MKSFNTKIRLETSRAKLVFLSGIISLVAVFGVVAPKVNAGDCDTNAIMHCGFTSSQNFIDVTRANRDGLGHTDLQAIFQYSGLSSADYTRFVGSAKDGTVYRDGRVVVNGQTVMTNSKTMGRSNFNNSSAIGIGGKTYYTGTPSQRWASGRESFAVKVLFDGNGTPQFTVMNVCGNPVLGDKVASGATCNALNRSPVAGKANTYRFTASAGATGLAQITKYVYDFGDGSAPVTKTNPTEAVEHTYDKVGTYTAKLTITASAPGGTSITSTSQTCQLPIRVDVPAVSIEKKVNDAETKEVKVGEEFIYSLLIKNTGSQALTSVVVTDKAPAGVVFVKADTGKVAADGKSYTHTIPSLAKDASVTLKITAKVTTYSDKAITNTACVSAPEVNPGEPTKDDDCDTAVVTNPMPVYECSRLTGPLLSGQTMGYRFTAESKTANGAVLKRALFVFGDGQSRSVNATAGSSTITTDYTYPTQGTYSAHATLYFDVFGVEKASGFNCYAKVEPSKPAVPECKPGIPVGDIRCNPCQYDASLPADDVRCVAPAATLPETGAGNVIALASAALVGGFLWYRHLLFRRHKRAYLAADFGASPLPLAEPFESPDPLAATPFAPQTKRRFSMRRRRQF
ncbi:DUF11 domain-containing protein [Candidatus Saccharibacteria bacterium]|nr:MAG: DUF11 domain-containing protein [Candidatus Saccharibacteria bacterium]